MKPSRLCYRAVEFRADSADGDGRTLTGHAAVFRTPTRIDSWEGTFDEEIARGAFSKTIDERTPVLQFDHGRDMRTGSVPIGAIEDLHEDKVGLFVRARLFENDVVEPIRQAIEGGAIDGMSFRFKVLRDEWRDSAGKLVKPDELSQLLWQPGDRGPLKRTIREVELFELGPVVFPAYAATTVGVRSLIADLDDDEKQQFIGEFIHEFSDELRLALTPPSDAVQPDTSDESSDAGPAATSESPNRAALRFNLKEYLHVTS